VNRIGQAGAVAEASSSLSCFYEEMLGIAFLRVVMGKAAVVGSGDDDHFSAQDIDVFGKSQRGNEASGLIGMRPPQDQEIPSFLLPLEFKNIRIAWSAFKILEITAQHFPFRESFAGVDDLFLAHPQERGSRENAEDKDKEKKDGSGDMIFFDSDHELLYQEKAEQKHHQNDGCAYLIPKIFLPKKIPDKMEGQIDDDQMIDDLHHFLNHLIQDGSKEQNPYPHDKLKKSRH
jgi:hypothetical protein